jgi:hypothetical protein
MAYILFKDDDGDYRLCNTSGYVEAKNDKLYFDASVASDLTELHTIMSKLTRVE